MQRINIILILILLSSFIITSCSTTEPPPDAKIYYIDCELMTLIGVPTLTEGSTVSAKAESMLQKLSRGQDFNRKIKRQIPPIKDALSVTVADRTAVVNLTEAFIENHEDGRICERLTVYQIVNSITSIDGIDSVRFTVCGKVEKNFKGFLDMRETFTHKDHVL